MHLITLLREEMTEAWAALERAMAAVTDDMLHWEPTPGCWGLRRRGARVVLDHDRPTPIPPVPKTIGWLAAHLATCKGKGIWGAPWAPAGMRRGRRGGSSGP